MALLRKAIPVIIHTRPFLDFCSRFTVFSRFLDGSRPPVGEGAQRDTGWGGGGVYWIPILCIHHFHVAGIGLRVMSHTLIITAGHRCGRSQRAAGLL